jgi:hypothetical protein
MLGQLLEIGLFQKFFKVKITFNQLTNLGSTEKEDFPSTDQSVK